MGPGTGAVGVAGQRLQASQETDSEGDERDPKQSTKGAGGMSKKVNNHKNTQKNNKIYVNCAIRTGKY